MFSPTRFPAGITNSNQGLTLGQFGAPDPTLFHTFLNDFDTFVAGDWTLTKIGAGGAAALVDGDGGLLQLTTDALDNDAIQLQNTVATFLMEEGKQAWFKTRCKIEKAVESDFLIGLCATDATVFDVTDGIFFQKDDGDTNLDFYVKTDSTTGQNVQAAVATIAADTFIVLGFYYDGKSSVEVYVNDVKVYTMDASSTYLPDAPLTVTMAYRNGEAGANDLTVDYIFAAKAR
jgi:hypothetical protein